jgi:DNA-binding NarL/FixJ family response regulator
MSKVPAADKRDGKFVPAFVYSRVETNGLSARERQIVAAVARGLSNRDIAAEAGIAQQTVKNHLSSIFQKLQVKSRVQLAVLAIQRGLTEPPG